MNLKNILRMCFFIIALLTFFYLMIYYFYDGGKNYDLGQAILVSVPYFQV